MKRAFTVYYDTSEFSTDNKEMIYTITPSKYFEGETELVKSCILRDCCQHFITAYNDGDPLSPEQLGGEYVGYAHVDRSISCDQDNTIIEKEARNGTDKAEQDL